MRLSDSEWAELKTKHPGAVCVSLANGDAAFRRPTRAEYHMFLDRSAETKHKGAAIESLCRACVIAPSSEEFGKWLEEQPGIAVSCVSPILDAAGVDEAVTVRK